MFKLNKESRFKDCLQQSKILNLIISKYLKICRHIKIGLENGEKGLRKIEIN